MNMNAGIHILVLSEINKFIICWSDVNFIMNINGIKMLKWESRYFFSFKSENLLKIQ